MKTELIAIDDPSALRHAADVLRYDGLVAFPTDTVYGVGAQVMREAAVQRLYTVKGRSTDKAIAVLVSQIADLAKVAGELTPKARRLAELFWPGPLTLVVPKHPSLPAAVSALPTVGVRLPNHPQLRKLLELAGPLAVTSANRSGARNSLTAQDVLEQLEGRIELVLDGGRVTGGVPSTVVDCSLPVPRVLREGPVRREEVEGV